MSSDYPVQVDVTSPPRFERLHVLLRIAIAIALGWLGITAGWLACVLFLVLPLIAAVAMSSQRGAYLTELAPAIWRALDWLLRLSAYMLMLVDSVPTADARDVVITARYTGAPTAGSALARLVTSIPSGVVLMLLWFVSGLLWALAALCVLLGLAMPRSILAFQRGVLRWNARLVAYHASLVAEYPPWSFDTEGSSDHGVTATAER